MISLLVPTRGRLSNMRRFHQSAWEMAEGPVEIVFAIDPDDPASRRAAGRMSGVQVVLPKTRLVLSEYWNLCAEAATGDILGHMGDDIIFRTPGWDRLVEEAFRRYADRIAFVHGRDGVHDAVLGTHGFLSREWVDTLGRFVPPHFAHDYNDTWLTEVADRIGRRVFLPDLLTEHMHPDVGRAEYDLTYQEHAEAGERDQVGALYTALASERAAEVEKLRACMTS